MKKKMVITLFLICTLITSLNFISCSNLNQSEVSKEYGKEDINDSAYAKIDVVSTDEYKLEGKIMDKMIQKVYFGNDGDIILDTCWGFQPQEAKNYYNKINLSNGIAKVVSNEVKPQTSSDYHFGVYYTEELDNDKVKIYSEIDGESYMVDKMLVKAEYWDQKLLDKYLVRTETNNEISTYREKIIWTNLDEGKTKELNFNKSITMNDPKEYNDKLYILYSTELGSDLKNNLMVINLKTSQIEADINIGSAKFVIPIDNKRVFLENGSTDTEYTLSMYNLENRTSKELIRWEKGNSWNISPIWDSEAIIISPSKDKILYMDKKDNVLSIKVAEIQGMSIGEAKSIYSVNVKDDDVVSYRTMFSEDGKSVYLVKYLNADSIIKVNLNK